MEDFDVTLSGDDIKVKMEENEDPLMCDSCGIYYAMISIIYCLKFTSKMYMYEVFYLYSVCVIS